MKIESKNKRKMFHEYILRSGHGVKREMPKSVTERAKEIMATKPYAGCNVMTPVRNGVDGGPGIPENPK